MNINRLSAVAWLGTMMKKNLRSQSMSTTMHLQS